MEGALKDLCGPMEPHVSGVEDSCMRAAVVSLKKAVERLQSLLGMNMQNWQYGNLHRKYYEHVPFTKNRFLRFFYDRSYPSSGNRRTVQVSFSNVTADTFTSKYSAGIRVVFTSSESEPSQWVIDTGISENIFSPHYDDQMKLYEEGKYITIISNTTAIDNLPTQLKLKSFFSSGNGTKTPDL